MVRRMCWRADRVFYEDDQGHANSIPTAWTSLEAPDAFVAVSAGRSFFHVANLLELASLVGELTAAKTCKANFAEPQA